MFDLLGIDATLGDGCGFSEHLQFQRSEIFPGLLQHFI